MEAEYYYVYILYSSTHDKYYIGQTSDLETRMLFHNELSENSFTSRYRPWELKKAIPVQGRRMARKMENYIKNRRSRNYVKSLIENEDAVQRLLRRFDSSVG